MATLGVACSLKYCDNVSRGVLTGRATALDQLESSLNLPLKLNYWHYRSWPEMCSMCWRFYVATTNRLLLLFKELSYGALVLQRIIPISQLTVPAGDYNDLWGRIRKEKGNLHPYFLSFVYLHNMPPSSTHRLIIKGCETCCNISRSFLTCSTCLSRTISPMDMTWNRSN